MIETIKIDGEEFAVDDFEGRELVEAEKAFGINLMVELDQMSMTGIYALIFLIKRRGNPQFQPSDALALSLGQVSKMVGDDQDEGEKVPPPARPAKGAKAKAA